MGRSFLRRAALTVGLRGHRVKHPARLHSPADVSASEWGSLVSLTVGVLAFNSERMLPDLLTSLPGGLAGVADWRLVIVDGASSDGTVEVARRLAPEASVIGLGANPAIAADSASDAVLILSPTVRLTPGCVAKLLAALEQPGAGIAVPRLCR